MSRGSCARCGGQVSCDRVGNELVGDIQHSSLPGFMRTAQALTAQALTAQALTAQALTAQVPTAWTRCSRPRMFTQHTIAFVRPDWNFWAKIQKQVKLGHLGLAITQSELNRSGWARARACLCPLRTPKHRSRNRRLGGPWTVGVRGGRSRSAGAHVSLREQSPKGLGPTNTRVSCDASRHACRAPRHGT